MMLEQLRVVPGMRVLEIGAGAGYNAALLAELVGPVGSVTTIELDPELASEAAAHLAVAGYSPARARVIAGDGWAGWAEGAPWDRIEATVGVWDISPAWVEQLASGGVLLAPLWLGVTDVSVALRKRAGALVSESWALCGFVRLRGAGAGQPPLVRIGGRRSLTGPGAEELAPRVAEALKLPSRRLRWDSPWTRVHPQPGAVGRGHVDPVADQPSWTGSPAWTLRLLPRRPGRSLAGDLLRTRLMRCWCLAGRRRNALCANRRRRISPAAHSAPRPGG